MKNNIKKFFKGAVAIATAGAVIALVKRIKEKVHK